MRSPRLSLLVLLALALPVGILGAQGLPPPGMATLGLRAHPAIPTHEEYRYSRTVGKATTLLRLTWDLAPATAGKPRAFEVRSAASDQTGFFRLDPLSCLLLSSELTTRGADGIIKRSTEILESRAHPGADEFLIGGFETLVYELRAFPWETASKARLLFLGQAQAASPFTFELTVTGREDLRVGGSTVPCYKATLALSGFLGGFVGKTYLWYAAAPAHYLVRSEGAAGPPGSPQVILMLESYSAP